MIQKKDILSFFEINRVLYKADDFIYLLPHPGLRMWISNYTITFPSKDIISDNYTVVPHGSATLVFSCSERGISDNLFGPATMPCMVGDRANQSDMLFIIEFQPAGLYTFTSVNQKELSNHMLPFYLVDSSLSKLIVHNLYEADNISELIHNIDQLLLSNLNAGYPSELNFTIHNIIENMGDITIKELSDSVFYSERHFNRMFDHYLGMNAKTFSRLVRINKAIRLLHNPQNNITKVCNLSGFYDLPHFIRDFKSVCGITPQGYRDTMSDFYSEIAKF